MAVFENPDFQNLPQPLATLLTKTAKRSFFALPIWYHVLATYGTDKEAVPVIYSDSTTPRAALACLAPRSGKRQLSGFTNYYSTEHGPLYDPAAPGWQNSHA